LTLADELPFLTIRELGSRLRRGALSSEELVRAAITRTERLEPRLHSYITFTPERALEAARAADDERRRGVDRGPLHGLPVSLKDHIDVAGVPTTAGAKLLADRIPDTDAMVVKRLREAGAIVMGKANMNQFAGGDSGWNPDYGKMANPRFPDYSVGGSSGGSGSQVAAGLVALSIGSDNGGSIRIPASLCGVVGLKPTFGRVSMDGVAPRSLTSDHLGPIARTVDDVAIALGVIGGHVPGSQSTARRPMPDLDAGAGEVNGLRIGVDRQYCQVGEPAVLKGFAAALQTFESLGATVHDVTMPDLAEVLRVGDLIFQPEVAVWFDSFAVTYAAALPAGLRAGWVGLGLAVTAVDYLRANQRRREMQIAFGRSIRDVDVVMLPSYFLARRPFPATGDDPIGGHPRIGSRESTFDDALRYGIPFDFFGLPALSLPCSLSAEGAAGLQIVGRAWDEARVLSVGRAYERVTDWHRSWPSLD
jgi:aspartyl-tRNA(Asn)/glutamyl-tRNA(Gln) amidotransferase subunit A